MMKSFLPATLCTLACSLIQLRAASLEVDKTKSRIQVDAKATGHSFTGTLTDYRAVVTGDPSSLKPASFELNWGFANLSTADEKRDAEMIKWLGGGAPKGSFKFTKTWSDQGKNYAMGLLTINGISKTVAFPYTASKNGAFVTTDGSVPIDYQDFNLPLIRAMAVMKVNPQLLVRFHIVGKIK